MNLNNLTPILSGFSVFFLSWLLILGKVPTNALSWCFFSFFSFFCLIWFFSSAINMSGKKK